MLDKNLSAFDWRLIDFVQAGGAWQMAADLYLYRAIESHPQPVIVRFYSFVPPAISIGYHQTMERVVDRQACAASGIDVVRRPTGGRALLHRDEINYAVIADTRRAGNFGAGLAEAFGLVSRGIASGLRELGIAAEVTGRPGRVQGKPAPVGAPGAGLCAESATRYEITAGQTKIAAAAQLRASNKLLQHGTIYLSETDIAPAVLFGRTFRSSKPVMTNLTTLLGKPPRPEVVIGALIHGFTVVFGARCKTAGFDRVEREAVGILTKVSSLTDGT